jgi:hypothetical protein
VHQSLTIDLLHRFTIKSKKSFTSLFPFEPEDALGVRKSGKGRRKLGRKKRRMRAKIRHRKK